MDDFKTIGIIGLGLIGGSYARKLTSIGHRVVAIDINQETINYGLNEKMIIEGSTHDYSVLEQADIVISCLYPKVFIQEMPKFINHFKENCVLTDVTGVKSEVVYLIKDMLPKSIHFIPSHPMAGKEVLGVKNSNGEIFNGCNFLITPFIDSNEQAIEIIESLASDLDCKTIARITPERHDEVISFTSQLTHAIAMSLMNVVDDIEMRQFTGDSFRELTRIANIDEVLWSELFLMNKKQLVNQIDNFKDELESLKQCIQKEEIDLLKNKMITSSEKQIAFLNK
jgi:prephenate dehydrogenase